MRNKGKTENIFPQSLPSSKHQLHPWFFRSPFQGSSERVRSRGLWSVHSITLLLFCSFFLTIFPWWIIAYNPSHTALFLVLSMGSAFSRTAPVWVLSTDYSSSGIGCSSIGHLEATGPAGCLLQCGFSMGCSFLQDTSTYSIRSSPWAAEW